MKNNWLNLNSLSKVFLTFVFAVLWTACADDSSNLEPVISDSAAGRVADNGIATTQTFETTFTLSQQNGPNTQTWSYKVTTDVTWTGSSSTWKYTVEPTLLSGDNADVKNLSHVNFGGLEDCISSYLKANGFAFGGDQGGCGDLPEGTVHKFDNLTSSTFSFSFTLPSAYAVNPTGLKLYVKAGDDCEAKSIAGPSCQPLVVTGTVGEIVCDGTTTVNDRPYNGNVTLSQGSVSHTVSAVNGVYSHSNIGGVWTVFVDGIGADASTTVAIEDQGTSLDANGKIVYNPTVVNHLIVDNRINSSCAAITGSATRTDCVNQSEVTTPYAGASVMNGSEVVGTTDDNGNFTISNVVDGVYNLTIGGVALNSVTVSGSQGSYDAGSVNVSFITAICGGDVDPACSLSQGYWFAKPQSTWGDGLTIGGHTYTKAEGVAIWNTTNKGGLLNVKAAFTQAAAIKLSGVDANASVWADVQIVENYLASLNIKLSATNINGFKNTKTGLNAEAGAAAGRIGQWIDANHCNEQ